MSEYIKVKDHPDLVRDSSSSAILNTNLSELNKYKEERNFKLKLAQVVQENEVMKSDINEIKGMLKQLLNKS